MSRYAVDDRVCGGEPGADDYDEGRVVEVVGGEWVRVAWRGSMVTTTQDASVLRPGWEGAWRYEDDEG